MNCDFNSYLDDLNIITSIIPKKLFSVSLEYFFECDNNISKLTPIGLKEENDFYKVTFILDEDVKLGKIYYIKTSNNLESILLMGKVSRSDKFDKLYSYNKELGTTYTKDYSIFRIWSPYSETMTLCLYNNDVLKSFDMIKKESIFEIKIDEDLKDYEYNFKIIINNKEIVVNDPYSYSINEFTNRSKVVDFDSLYKYQYNNDFTYPIKDTIIYETNIRDFTSFFKDDLKSTYDYFYNTNLFNDYNNESGLKHAINLGITHIELMPVNLFYGIDFENRFNKYNWGYNPINYFSFTNNYSINPKDPISRINEFRRLVDNLHKNKLKVILDVVYNHVNKSYDFEYEKLVPGYSFRYDQNGIITEHSGCENDLDSDRYMIKKLIIDNLVYLLKTFDVDGFRFDLMGLLSKDLINEASTILKSIKKDIILFGEGWVMGEYEKYNLSNMLNKDVSKDVGFFNDYFRNTIIEFILGKDIDIKEAMLDPSCYKDTLNSYSRRINYLECHDDYTLYDYIKLFSKDFEEEIKERCLLGLSLLLLSSGISFIHSGMEFFNNKMGKHNTYNLGDEYNYIDWNKLNGNEDNIEFIKELINFKKNNDEIDNVLNLDQLVILDSKKYYVLVSNTNTIKEYNINEEKVIIKSPNIEVNDTYIKGLGVVIIKK